MDGLRQAKPSSPDPRRNAPFGSQGGGDEWQRGVLDRPRQVRNCLPPSGRGRRFAHIGLEAYTTGPIISVLADQASSRFRKSPSLHGGSNRLRTDRGPEQSGIAAKARFGHCSSADVGQRWKRGLRAGRRQSPESVMLARAFPIDEGMAEGVGVSYDPIRLVVHGLNSPGGNGNFIFPKISPTNVGPWTQFPRREWKPATFCGD